MKVLKAIGSAVLAVAAVLGGVGSFAQWAGIEFSGVVGTAIDAAPAWLPAASLILGVLIGWNAKKRHELMSYHAPLDPIILESKTMKKSREVIADMEAELKALLMATVDKGTAYADSSEWRSYLNFQEDYLNQFLEWNYADDNITLLKPTDRLAALRSECADLFEQASKTMNTHGVSKGTRPHFGGYSGMPDWWWYI